MNFIMSEKISEENEAMVIHWMVSQVLGVPSTL